MKVKGAIYEYISAWMQVRKSGDCRVRLGYARQAQ